MCVVCNVQRIGINIRIETDSRCSHNAVNGLVRVAGDVVISVFESFLVLFSAKKSLKIF